MVVATGGGRLVCLAVGEGALTEAASVAIDAEVACLDASPLEEGAEAATLLAVGTWGMDLRIFTLPGLAKVAREAVGGEVIPRSVLFSSFDGVPYLLCGLGDGHLITFRLAEEAAAAAAAGGAAAAAGAALGPLLLERKKLALGTKPITLRTFRSRGASHVFAASDRPTIIYASNRKLLYSNLNENEVRADGGGGSGSRMF